MPELCRFLGIVIRMHYREHVPAHFHAEYGEYEISVEIESGVVKGKFPRRALSAVMEWYVLHLDELRMDWYAAMNKEPLTKIEPLE